MDTESIIARIDHLLRVNGPPSDAVLKKVADVLSRSRSGEAGASAAVDTLSPDLLASVVSNASSTGSTSSSQRSQRSTASWHAPMHRPASASHTATAASSFRSSHAAEHDESAAAPAATRAGSTASSPTDDKQVADDGGEMGMSLPLGRQARDVKQVRTIARHRERVEKMKPVVDIRERATRQYQALLEGRGGKIVHADIVENGATQIGGMTSQTPSMYPGSIGQIAGRLIAGGEPRIRNLPSDFRLV